MLEEPNENPNQAMLESQAQPQKRHVALLEELNALKRQLIHPPDETALPLRKLERVIAIVFPAFIVESFTFGLFTVNCLVWSVQLGRYAGPEPRIQVLDG